MNLKSSEAKAKKFMDLFTHKNDHVDTQWKRPVIITNNGVSEPNLPIVKY